MLKVRKRPHKQADNLRDFINLQCSSERTFDLTPTPKNAPGSSCFSYLQLNSLSPHPVQATKTVAFLRPCGLKEPTCPKLPAPFPPRDAASLPRPQPSQRSPPWSTRNHIAD